MSRPKLVGQSSACRPHSLAAGPTAIGQWESKWPIAPFEFAAPFCAVAAATSGQPGQPGEPSRAGQAGQPTAKPAWNARTNCERPNDDWRLPCPSVAAISPSLVPRPRSLRLLARPPRGRLLLRLLPLLLRLLPKVPKAAFPGWPLGRRTAKAALFGGATN